jgi:hypothetical protein
MTARTFISTSIAISSRAVLKAMCPRPEPPDPFEDIGESGFLDLTGVSFKVAKSGGIVISCASVTLKPARP